MRTRISSTLARAKIEATVAPGFREGANTVYDIIVQPGTTVTAIEQALAAVDSSIRVVRSGASLVAVYVPDPTPVVVVEEVHNHYHINVTVNVVLDELENWANLIGGRVRRRGAVAYLLDDVGRCIHETAIA